MSTDINEENIEIYGLFVNQELIKEGSFNEMVRVSQKIEEKIKNKYESDVIETMINEFNISNNMNKLIRIESDEEVIFYDIRLILKKEEENLYEKFDN